MACRGLALGELGSRSKFTRNRGRSHAENVAVLVHSASMAVDHTEACSADIRVCCMNG